MNPKKDKMIRWILTAGSLAFNDQQNVEKLPMIGRVLDCSDDEAQLAELHQQLEGELEKLLQISRSNY